MKLDEYRALHNLDENYTVKADRAAHDPSVLIWVLVSSFSFAVGFVVAGLVGACWG